jgi:anti-sigma B factor antagonist
MADSTLRATVRRENQIPIIDLIGEVNAFAEESLNAAFTAACGDSPALVVLNFADVVYMNSTGIALIVALLAQARKLRLPLRVTGLSEHYRHIFTITRLADFMSIYEDEASALADQKSAGSR